jgi:hypothetical protein
MKPMTRAQLDAWADERDLTVRVMTGLDAALVGVAQVFTNEPIAVYSYRGIIKELVSQGMTPEEADEYFRFNIQGAYVGEGTPAVMYDNKDVDNGSI